MKKLLFLLGALLLACCPTQATISAGDATAKCNAIASADPFTCAWTGTANAGNLVVVAIHIQNDRTIASVVDNCSTVNTYEVTKTKSGTSNGLWHYAAVIDADCANGTVTVDITGGLSGGSDVAIFEYSSSTGWDNTTMANNVESTIARTSATDSTVVSGSFNTTQASTLIVCHSKLGNARTTTTLLPTGAAELTAQSDLHKFIYAIETTAQTGITCGYTVVGGSTTWLQDGVVYKDVAASGVTPIRRRQVINP